MRAIIGLGNPGKKYVNTRHNIGHYIIDYILHQYHIPLKAGKGDYYYAEHLIGGVRSAFFKPTAFMNHSGLAVVQILKYFPVGHEDLLIVYDDFNLPLGTIRFRSAGSDGGHNGIASIIYQLKTETFDRMRLGIGWVDQDAVAYVLSNFSKEESAQIDRILPNTREAIECWIEQGIEITMNRYNRSFINGNSS